MFREKKTDTGLVYYSDLLNGIEHYFTTRESNVEDNFDGWCKYLGIDDTSFIHPTQTHTPNIQTAVIGVSDYPDTDSLILNNHNQAIYLRFADCTPVIIYDKKANIGAIAHAGWRGTVEGIVPKTVNKMRELTNSDINDYYIAIGPAIGQCCYQVGEEVITAVKKSVKDESNLITPDNRIDLKGVNARQLTEIGIPEENIDICPFCTSCRSDLFYSYRKENGTDKRHNAIIKLKRATA